MAIAFFYAVGTGLGGIIGPVLFGRFIEQGRGQVAFGYYLGAGLMIAAGLVELVLGVEAAQRSLEDIATPLTTVEEAEDAAPAASREEAPAASGFRWGPP
jgi:MFS family permease